jgi:2-polyprenyl-6-methoxyphenol hydroxylase-like FAD-dependent oxidoreductase
MAEAYVLAGELCRANNDYDEAFRRYEQKLRPFIEAKQRSAYNSASSFAPRTQTGIWFRDFIASMLGIPLVANYFIGRLLRDDFDLPYYDVRSVSNPHSMAL